MAGQDHILSKAFLATTAGFTNSIVLGQCVVLVDPGASPQLDPNQVALAGTTAGNAQAASPIGLAAENMDLVKIQTGKAYFNVIVLGVAFGIASAAISVGNAVTPATTAGQLAPLTIPATASQKPVVGIAMTHAAAAGDIFAVLLTPGQRA
jgi:hypothetical protein